MTCPAGLAALFSALSLAGCTEPPARASPAFYQSLAQPGAAVDTMMARDMISAYRRNQGLPPLALDPTLQELAEAEARAMARADKPASAEAVKARVAAAGFTAPAANLSEAFSGWRESGQHNRVMLDRAATRLGIATAYAPGSKYKVYWALVVDEEDDRCNAANQRPRPVAISMALLDTAPAHAVLALASRRT